MGFTVLRRSQHYSIHITKTLWKKQENAGSPTMFSTLPSKNLNFSVTFILSSAAAFNFNQSKIMSSG